MISYVTYKAIHYLGIFGALAAVAGYAVLSGTGGAQPAHRPWARTLSAAHGIGLFLALLGGFGMLARLGVSSAGMGLPLWIWIKLAIWVVFGAILVLARRRPETARWVLLAAPLLAVCAGMVALLKPGL